NEIRGRARVGEGLVLTGKIEMAGVPELVSECKHTAHRAGPRDKNVRMNPRWACAKCPAWFVDVIGTIDPTFIEPNRHKCSVFGSHDFEGIKDHRFRYSKCRRRIEFRIERSF